MNHIVFIIGMLIFWPMLALYETISISAAKKNVFLTIGTYTILNIIRWGFGC